MKNVLLLTTTPTVGGNRDVLIAAAMEEAKEHGAKVQFIHIREKQIGFCRACYGCAITGVCVQKDDFMDILRLAHEYRTEVFTRYVSDSTCHDRADYLDRAKKIARWAVDVQKGVSGI